MNVILCGYHWAGCRALELLHSQGHNIYVFTHNPSPLIPHIPDVPNLCKKLGVEYSLKKIRSSLLPFKPDLLCSIYYRKIISKAVIEQAEGRAFNLHPALLPKYRGCSSLTWAMTNGEELVGYSYHYLVKEVDAGNIIIQKPMKVHNYDTQTTLFNRVMFEALNDFSYACDLVMDDFEGLEQNHEKATYYKRGAPHDGVIGEDWSVDRVEKFIRAMTHPPLPYATFRGHEIQTLDDYFKVKNAV
jgi:UDP-4-amino-4-deoxy-L-arabinose formyltransferase/UDP-glucuronic acid dehydrogenase (UDP-4-keto-hexauronic acid decarboxylating)